MNGNRVDAIQRAFLAAARHFYAMGGPLATGRNLAQFVIYLNDQHCGTNAQHVHDLLVAQGVNDVCVRSIGPHIGLLDTRTNLLYDIEDLEGVPLNTAMKQPQALAQIRRVHAVCFPGISDAEIDSIRSRDARAWDVKAKALCRMESEQPSAE